MPTAIPFNVLYDLVTRLTSICAAWRVPHTEGRDVSTSRPVCHGPRHNNRCLDRHPTLYRDSRSLTRCASLWFVLLAVFRS